MEKIIYMGTPDFAIPAFEAILKAGYEIPCVVTKPDAPKDRGKKIQFSSVKKKAVMLEIPVLQPEKIKTDSEFMEKIKLINPDLIVVAAYGKILPEELLNIPKFGCINIHGSILPKYRGAAPIHRAVINGEEETGVTLMYMAKGMDAGDMIAHSFVKINQKTTGELHEELAVLGADLLIENLPNIFHGSEIRIPQSEQQVTYAPMVSKEEGHVNFSAKINSILCLIRGMNSWPGAYAFYKDKPMKIWEAKIGKEGFVGGTFGEIIGADSKGIEIIAGDGTIVLLKIQMPGKKAMNAADYLRGNQIDVGAVLK